MAHTVIISTRSIQHLLEVPLLSTTSRAVGVAVGLEGLLHSSLFAAASVASWRYASKKVCAKVVGTTVHTTQKVSTKRLLLKRLSSKNILMMEEVSLIHHHHNSLCTQWGRHSIHLASMVSLAWLLSHNTQVTNEFSQGNTLNLTIKLIYIRINITTILNSLNI